MIFMQLSRLLILCLCLLFAFSKTAIGSGVAPRWYKGALHCHSTVSDGDSSPEEVRDWHRNHGYDFMVLTDHDRYSDVEALGLNRYNDFLVIPGEEVGIKYGKQNIHINAINSKHFVKPIRGKSVEEILQKNVLAIRKAGGIAMINHPYYEGRITECNMAAIGGFFLLEVHNAMVSTGQEHEMLLDRLTAMRKHVYGIASDDSHYIKAIDKSTWGAPGKAWIMVRAPSLTVENIMKSLKNGDFYCTTGVILSDIQISDKEYRVEVVPEKGITYTISFKSGELAVRQLSVGIKDTYRFSGKEPYIRAKIMSSNGHFALTQPHLIKLK